MKKVLFVLIGVFFFMGLFSDAMAKTKWDLHLNYPAGNFHSRGAQQFADRVSAATGGEGSVNNYV